MSVPLDSPATRPLDAHLATAPPAARWQVRLLGDVCLDDGQHEHKHQSKRLPTHAAAALLARLALAPQRAHAREELIELLWPGVALAVGRNRLRNVLSTLKTLLEGDGGAAVLVADRTSVRVASGALGCDALNFERAWRSGRFDQARALYAGELMPGYFDEWISDERLRLAALADRLPTANLVQPPAALSAHAAGAAPAYLTRLFGRQRDLAHLRDHVLAHRLVSLIGPGGFGKTRLAAQLATGLALEMALEPMSPPPSPRLDAHVRVPGSVPASVPAPPVPARFDPVLFVALVGCTSRAEVLQQVALTLACEASLAAIERALAGRRALLVLDNFEHLVTLASDVPQALLARLPNLHLLVTSRSVLGLDGEHELVLGALPVPSTELTSTELATNPAVALFVDRARSARADFELHAGNEPAIAGLVRALEGMPLALELAAARCRSLSPADMLRMLSEPPDPHQQPAATPALDLLLRRGPRGDRDARQASMARVVAWSWELLDAPARSLLAALTVFRTHFSAEAAAAVTGLSALEVGVALDTLTSHSLLQLLPSPGTPHRFHLLEVIRQFATTQLAAERGATLRAAMRGWLIDWARHAGRMPLPARIDPELPHVHAVLADVLSRPADAQIGAEAMQLALALRDYWELDGMPPHSQQALERVLVEFGAQWPANLRGDAHELLAYTSIGAGDGASALAHADQALALAMGDDLRHARAVLRRVWVKLAIDYQSPGQSAPLEAALAVAQRCADLPLQARALHHQGILARYQQRDPAAAEALFAQAQALWIELGNQRLAHARLRNRAQCWALQGRHVQALASFEQCEQAARVDGDWVGIIDSTLGAANALSSLRQWPLAVAKGAECIRVCWQRHHAHGLSYAFWNIAYPMLRNGRAQDAVRLMAQASHYWTSHMGPLRADDQRDIVKIRRMAAAHLPPEQIDALWQAGAAMPVADAVALVLRA